MKRFHGLLLLGALALGVAAPGLVTPVSALAEEPTGMRRELIRTLDDAGRKIIELAEATPEAKYSWSPGKDVRTTGQVFVHIIGANYMLPMLFAGAKPPITEDLRQMEATPPAKAKIVEMLKGSFAFAKESIAGMADADLLTPTKMFDGSEGTKATWLMITVSHAHEHLGQSIAYARSNGIVPPWTAREEAEAKAKKAGDK